jgi:predicted transcriptional regulator YheO
MKMVKKNQDILVHYIKVGEIIAEMFSPYLEVIVHDLTNPNQSIIAIFNSHITGRKIGDGTSDIGYKKLSNKLPDKIVNYSNKSPSGVDLKSSSLTIRNDDNEIIGSMGFNFDLSTFVNIKEFIDLFSKSVEMEELPKIEEFFMWNIKIEIQQAINKYFTMNKLQGKVLNREDKLKVISYMKDKGYFSKKGAKTTISELLAISRPTLYKYLKEI